MPTSSYPHPATANRSVWRLMSWHLFACLLLPLATVIAADPAPTSATLKSVFTKDFICGAAIPTAGIPASEIDLLTRHFSNLTPENCMKPQPLQPVEGQFRFAEADALVNLAQRQGLTVHGHTLVWHQACPEWFFVASGAPASPELVRERMRAHIAAVAGHFAGKVASWDVVNEAIDDGGGYLRASKWRNILGEDFIADAFIAARAADPTTDLYYNDYSIEMPDKRAKTLRLLTSLQARKVPIQGVGIQGHWQLDRVPFRQIEEAIIAFHALGLQVAISELDIDVVVRKTSGAEAGTKEQGDEDPYAAGVPADVQQRLAQQYAQLFALFRKHADKISRVTFWGLHDGRTWLNYWPRKRTNHPLLFARDLSAKPALAAVLAAGKP